MSATRTIVFLALTLTLTGVTLAQAYETTELRMSSTSTPDARRGQAVSIVGDLDRDGYDEYAVGAPYEDPTAGTNAGVVRVYSGRTGGLMYTINGTVPGYRLGYSIDGAGDFNGDGTPDIVIGGWGGSSGGTVKVISGATGGTIMTLTETAGWGLGFCVAGAGDCDGDGRSDIVYGLPHHDPNGLTNAGQVRVEGINQTIRIYDGNQAHQQMGFSVDGCGDFGTDGLNEIVCGAPFYNVGFPNASIGRVQVFSPMALLASPIIDHIPNNGLIGNHWNCGYSVAGMGDVNGDGIPDIAAGCRGYSPNGATADGRIQLISGAASIPPVVLDTYTAPSGSNQQLGLRVHAAGDLNGDGITDLLASAPNYTPNADRLGRVLALSGANLSVLDEWRGTGHFTDYGFGIGGGGDTNGDGTPDVIIGAPRFDSPSAFLGGQDQGRAWVYSGAGDYRNHADFVGLGLGDHPAVAILGDLNGDGFDEYAYGNRDSLNNNSDVGVVTVWNGADGALLTTINGPGGPDRFGAAIDGAGDCDADGTPDIVIGAPRAGGGAGRAYVYSGDDFSLMYTLSPFGNTCTALNYGAVVAAAGDVNGDGHADVLVSDPNCDNFTNAGRVYLYSGLDGTLMWAWDGNTLDSLGASVDGIGDINDDGFDDFAIGVPGDNGGDGRVDVYLGQASFPFHSYMGSITGSNGEGLGTAVAGAGDVDADGIPDIVAGAPYNTSGPLLQALTQRGRVAVFSGTNLAQLYGRIGDGAWDHLGESVSGAGDFDGDGHADFMGGAPDGDSQGHLSNGYVYIWSGKNGSVLQKVIGPLQNSTALGQDIAGGGRISPDARDDVLIGSRQPLAVGNPNMTHVVSYGDLVGLDHFGLGTPYCDGPVLCTANSPPVVGNAMFGYTCRNAPPTSNATFLVTFSGFESVPGLDLTGAGILFHADFVASPPFAQFPMSSDINGYGTSPAPMPNIPTLAGFTATIQGVWFSNPNCPGPIFGVSTTNGLNVTIQP